MHKMENKLAEFWGQVDQVVANLLTERQTLIVLLCKINGLEEYLNSPSLTKSTPVPLSVKVKAFCQVLMDYVSAGHFEVYEKLLTEADTFGDQDIDPIKSLYPTIERSTQLAVSFNDKYDQMELDQALPDGLQADLSALGEALEERFELEDQFIEHFHNRHKIQLRSA